MWPFRKKPEPKAPPHDKRNWNEDWKVGDTAECVVKDWHESVQPWNRPNFGDRLVVIGFSEEIGSGGSLSYFLRFAEFNFGAETIAFRKVRPVASEKSEVVERILNAKPGVDIVRVDAAA